MGPKHTGELWVYIGTPLANPSGNTGVMVCMCIVINKAQNIFHYVGFKARKIFILISLGGKLSTR